MIEVAYGESTSDLSSTGTVTYIDTTPVAVVAGTVIFEAFIPQGIFAGSGTTALTLSVSIDGTPTITLAGLLAQLADAATAVYAQEPYELTSSGTKHFELKATIAPSGSGQIIASSPRISAWFRVLADVPSPPDDDVKAISHTFGLA